MPSSFSASTLAVRAARGQAAQLRRVLNESRLPIVVVDNQRRYLEVNTPALLALRLSLAEMRSLRIDDLTPPDWLGEMEAVWKRLMGTGSLTGHAPVATPDGGQFEVYYWALANALPGEHVIAFAIAPVPDDAPDRHGDPVAGSPAPLTPRERELLQLAAHGLSGPRIAEELVLSRSTVRTHFEHIYEKLGVGDRAGAVATAMRLGLIE